MPENESPRDLTRTTLAVLCLIALTVVTIWVVRPFLTAFLWATMIVISTWPILLRLQASLGGRRGLATTCMVIVLLLVLVIPLSLSLAVLISNLDSIVGWVQSLPQRTLPPLPGWVAEVPGLGPKAAAAWQRITPEGFRGLAAKALPYADRILGWFLGTVGGIGGMILQFLLTVLMAGVLYSNGEAAAMGVRRFAHRLAGASGENAAILAGNSIRAVAVGVVVTALVQTAIGGAGLFIASVPAAPLLVAAILVSCLAQLGPILIMFPAVIWVYYTRGGGWSVVLLVFTLIAGTIDNVLRPILIGKGAGVPIALILTGVIGGLIAFGIMGIFVGPVILAVSHVLLQEWVGAGPRQARESAD